MSSLRAFVEPGGSRSPDTGRRSTERGEGSPGGRTESRTSRVESWFAGTARLSLCCALISLIASCGGGEPDSVRRQGEPDVVSVGSEDGEMNFAMARARVTFGEFEAELAEPRPGATYSVKALFDEAGAVEHLWLSELSVENGVLTGTIDNEPVQLSRVRLGDRVEVDRNLVSDWMVIEDGRYRGGFTVRVLRDRMAPTQRKELDRVMGASPAEPAGSS